MIVLDEDSRERASADSNAPPRAVSYAQKSREFHAAITRKTATRETA
ncbi:hypothetical protein SB764_07365 [Paraburkholderia sp. SIMBA_027]